MSNSSRIEIIDSHTGGEPTRLILSGGPNLGIGPLSERVHVFADRHDNFRSAVVCEPRGSSFMVGALLCEPHEIDCQFGVIFFNSTGYLGMCGHGIIGLVASLAHLARIQPGTLRIDTPVGVIAATLHDNGEVSFHNVPSYRSQKDLALNLRGLGEVKCDLAWGGNWFCLVENHGQTLEIAHVAHLTDYTTRILEAVKDAGFPAVNHVELFAPSSTPGVSSRNFVLCPGKVYDRSPCGTGTSAKLACLAADGQLAAGEEWVQESIVGSIFRGKYHTQDDKIIPVITGVAHIIAEGVLIRQAGDPFSSGIR